MPSRARSRPRPRARPSAYAGRLPRTAYQRRRAAALLAALAGAALIAGAAVGAAGGAGRPSPIVFARSGYFARLRTLASSGAGSFAVREQVAESAAITHTLSYTPFVRVAGSEHREIALTFDDGPGPYTLGVLKVLDREHVPATFFEVGIEERYFHAGTAALVAHGDPIGDHTESHAPMSQLSARDQVGQLLRETAAIGDWGAPFPRLFRPPYGLWNSNTLRLLRKYRMLMVLWTVDTGDYQVPGTATIVHRALTGVKPGAIILLHDAGGNRSETVAALPAIIRGLRARGYRLVTIPRLLLDDPPPADQDVASLTGAGG